ncbi:hypothetical protein VB735_15310 [Halotia wernerae UHCC 0503]|nr:hypothetical protein [Halotia wernerae UHCC 0503]
MGLGTSKQKLSKEFSRLSSKPDLSALVVANAVLSSCVVEARLIEKYESVLSHPHKARRRITAKASTSGFRPSAALSVLGGWC